MVNRNWFDLFGNPRGQNVAQNMPMPQMPTQFEQARVSPTREYTQTNMTNSVVPHFHPSHLNTVNQHTINNQHYFPHTESVVNECYETHTMCGTPFRPRHCGCVSGCPRCRGR